MAFAGAGVGSYRAPAPLSLLATWLECYWILALISPLLHHVIFADK